MPCPYGSSGSDVASGCSCAAGYAGTIVASRDYPYYSGDCAAQSCPPSTVGSDLPNGCTCGAGYEGAVTATTTSPYYNSTCTPVACPTGAGVVNGTTIVTGCHCEPGFSPGTLIPTVGAPYYTGPCTAVPCPGGTTGTTVAAGCTCPEGPVVPTSTAPFFSSPCVGTSCVEYYTRNPSSPSGPYNILVGSATVQVYCDMSTTMGGVGGWTLVAMRVNAVQMFTEPAMTSLLPTNTGSGRIDAIFSMSNANYPFTAIRYTNNDPNWAIATFSSQQTFASLDASNPSYSQYPVIPSATVTSSVSSLVNYYWRAMSYPASPYSDSADWAYMAFTVAPPISSGDGWDLYNPSWILAGTDNSYDPSVNSNVACGLGVSGTTACHWWGACTGALHQQTYVWLR